MTISAPPRSSAQIEALAEQVEPSAVQEQALIEEARQRTRRRRRRYGARVALVAAVIAIVSFSVGRGGDANGSVAEAQGSNGAGSGLPRNGPLTIVSGKLGDSSGGGLYEVGKDGLGDSVFRCGVDTPCWELEGVGWAPDGKRLAYGAESLGGNPLVNGLYVRDLVAGKSRHILRWNSSTERGGWYEIAWSPDGNRIAYATAPAAGCCGGRSRIFLITPDGKHKTRLETGTASAAWPSWSPDGNRIAFAAAPINPGGDYTPPLGDSIYVMRTDGTKRTLIARHGTAPAWSPDGTRIAYLGGCGLPPFRSSKSTEIRLVTRAGRNLTHPTDADCATLGVAGAPAWSPDGTKIAVANSRGVFVMNANGTNLRQLTASRPWSVASNKLSWARPAWQPIPQPS